MSTIDEKLTIKMREITGLTIQSSFHLGIEKCGVGGRIWKSGLAFCQFVEQYKMNFDNKSIIELGAGTGLSSIITLKSSKPKKLIITDVDQGCLKAIKQNIEINKSILNCERTEIRVENVNFGKDEDLNRIIKENVEGFDYVIGTDLIYGDYLVPLLTKGIDKLSYKKGCQIVLILNTIFPEVNEFIENIKKSGKFCVRVVEAEEMDDIFYKIKIFFIQRRKYCN